MGVLDDGRCAAAIAAGKPNRRGMFFGLTPDGVEWWSVVYRVAVYLIATSGR